MIETKVDYHLFQVFAGGWQEYHFTRRYFFYYFIKNIVYKNMEDGGVGNSLRAGVGDTSFSPDMYILLALVYWYFACLFTFFATNLCQQENNAVFVMTNMIITPNQTQNTCPENSKLPGVQCTNDGDCKPLEPVKNGHGMHL